MILSTSVGEFLNTELFHIGGTPFTPVSIIILLAFIVATSVVSFFVRRAVNAAMSRSESYQPSAVKMTNRLVHYLVTVVGLAIGLTTIGVNLTALFAAGAFLAVGVGFAVQNILENFFSGLILITERSVKHGDVLEVEGQLVLVQELKIRTTICRNLDGDELIVPNTKFAQNIVTNQSLNDRLHRVIAQVGVHYESDMHLTREVLLEAAQNYAQRSDEREPTLFLDEFGTSSVNFSVVIWTDDPWRARPIRSDLMFDIWDALKRAGITISYPQVDVHFDAPVHDYLGAARPEGGERARPN